MKVFSEPRSLFRTKHWKNQGRDHQFYISSTDYTSSGTYTNADTGNLNSNHGWRIANNDERRDAHLTTKMPDLIKETAKEVVSPSFYSYAGCVFVDIDGVTLMRDQNGLIHQSAPEIIELDRQFTDIALIEKIKSDIPHEGEGRGDLDDWISDHFELEEWNNLMEKRKISWRMSLLGLMKGNVVVPLKRWFGLDNITVSLYNRAVQIWESLKHYTERLPSVAAMALHVPWSSLEDHKMTELMEGNFHIVHQTLRETELGQKPGWTYLCKMSGEKACYLSEMGLEDVAHYLSKIGKSQEPAPSIDLMKHLDQNHPDWFWRLVSRNEENISSDELQEVIDWLENKEEALDKNQRSSWRHIKRRSDEWHAEIAAGTLDMTESEIEELEKITWPSLISGYQNDGVRFVALDNAAKLKKEGSLMGHCIGGQSYVGNAIRNKRRYFRIFVKEEGKWEHTSTCTLSKNGLGWKIKQVKGNGEGSSNASPPQAVKDVIDELLAAYCYVEETRFAQGLDPHPEPPERSKEKFQLREDETEWRIDNANDNVALQYDGAQLRVQA